MLQNAIIRFPLYRKEESDDKKVHLNFLFPLFVLCVWRSLSLERESFGVCAVYHCLDEVKEKRPSVDSWSDFGSWFVQRHSGFCRSLLVGKKKTCLMIFFFLSEEGESFVPFE